MNNRTTIVIAVFGVVIFIVSLKALLELTGNQPSINPYNPTKMFTHQGCMVYSFEYRGRAHFYSNCTKSAE